MKMMRRRRVRREDDVIEGMEEGGGTEEELEYQHIDNNHSGNESLTFYTFPPFPVQFQFNLPYPSPKTHFTILFLHIPIPDLS